MLIFLNFLIVMLKCLLLYDLVRGDVDLVG